MAACDFNQALVFCMRVVHGVCLIGWQQLFATQTKNGNFLVGGNGGWNGGDHWMRLLMLLLLLLLLLHFGC